MSLAPLLNASTVIQIHAFAAIAALILGIIQLSLRKGSRLHKKMGYTWAALMIVVAFSSLFIHQIRMWGPFSPIHLLSLNTLIGVPFIAWRASQGDFKRHGTSVKLAFYTALVLAGLFTLAPGRIMNQVLFGS